MSELVFTDHGGSVQIDDLASAPGGIQQTDFNSPVSSLVAGDTIRVEGFGNFSTIDAATPTFNSGTGNTTLALTDAGVLVANLTLAGHYSGDVFTVATEPNISGAVNITCCFMPGTLIKTSRGELTVETLKRGEMVITTAGTAEPIGWIGRQTISTSFADPLRVLPIRIMQGALGDNVPSRDLLLSPDHAILIDDVLIQAGALVNGTSIIRETDVPETFTYYHIELDGHSLIFAENTPAETFVDNIDRLAFDNWDEYEALYPEGKSIVEMPYPRAKAHRQVPRAIRERLAERGAILYGASAVAA